MNEPSSQPTPSAGWPKAMYAALAAVIVLAAGGIFYWQSSHQAQQTPQTIQAAAPQAPTEPQVRRFSDGVLVSPDDQPKRWYAVMVENSSDARPLSGLSQARLVIEAPVEGSIPRFMALFDDKQTVAKIGPVRSARPYYLDWALGLKAAMYVHVGGSPDALSKITTLSVQDFNQFFWGDYFWRSTDRFAPHNVYTSIDKLTAGFAARDFSDGQDLPQLGWTYLDESQPATSATQAVDIRIPFSEVATTYDAVWQFDAATDAYSRSQDTKPQLDQDNTPVTAKNVLVIKTAVSVIDDDGRRAVTTIGQGQGYLFRDGKQIPVQWVKTDRGAPLQINDQQGKPVALHAGPTWVEVVPLSTTLSVHGG